MGRQGRGRRLTDRERLEIVEIARRNPRVTHVALAASYHVNESTIRKWRREDNASRIRARHDSSGRDDLRRGQTAHSEHFDAQLFAWICAERARGVRLPPVDIRKKARALAATYDQMTGFKASSGWYYRYCRRFDLPCPAVPSQQSETMGDSDEQTGSSIEEAAFKLGESKLRLDFQRDADRSDSQVNTLGDAKQPKIEPCCVVALADATHTSEGDWQKLGSACATATARHGPHMSLEARQTAIVHFLHHHVDLLTRDCRLYFIQYLANTPEEMTAFARMDNVARVAYTKRFAARHCNGPNWCRKVEL